MRGSFSPTSAAARLMASPANAPKRATAMPSPMEARSCEWPRRRPAPAARGGIWRALQQIQAGHA